MPWANQHNYIESKKIRAQDPYFYSLLLALVFKADTDNLARLEMAFPGITTEVRVRYNTPYGFFNREEIEAWNNSPELRGDNSPIPEEEIKALVNRIENEKFRASL